MDGEVDMEGVTDLGNKDIDRCGKSERKEGES